MTTVRPASTTLPFLLACLTAAALAGCGGGGGGGSSSNNSGGTGTAGWTPNEFQPAERFVARCASPRSGIDPATGEFWPDIQGTVTDENNWLRSWSNDLYLWYDEIEDVDPAGYSTPEYFDLLKTHATTASGTAKDKFHFTYPTDAWYALAQSGVSAGYGAEWVILSDQPPRELVVAYTQPGSPATAANVHLARGAEVLTVDGVDLVNVPDEASVDTLNRGLWPASAGETHTFTVRDLDGTTRVVTMQSADVSSVSVQHVQALPDPLGPVGYMLFNDHLANSEEALIDAIRELRSAHVTDLVLDIRYNGGGYLDIASELAYMIAGPQTTAGRTFELVRFNGKHPSTNPVTGVAIEPIPFHNESQGFSVSFGEALPTLDLPRVFVLTGPDTCSASESVMNSLMGVDVEVIQIGSTTCGKPYGFYATDNCGTTYFSIQFQGVNAKGFGDYTDGFAPSGTGTLPGTPVPGCEVPDDFTHELGDPDEARLSVALSYRSGAQCTEARVARARSTMTRTAHLAAIDGRMHKSPWLESRMLRR